MRDVAEIQLTRVKAYLILEPELSMIDCGYAGSERRIARAITAHSRDPAELRRVVITHGHPDHAGSARALAGASVSILIHPADGRTCASPGRTSLPALPAVASSPP